jgi:wobble nucleotide-excising tRNase
VLVFSHDPYFLKQILGIKPEPETKVLHVKTTQSGSSTIDVCDLAALTRSQYFRDYGILKAFAERREGEPHLVAPAIRRLLETYLRTKSPNSFPANVYLGEMICKIRLAASGTALYKALRHLDSLDAINTYSQVFHHGEGAGVSAEILNLNELYSYVTQTLEIVEEF